jgi:hypothetical protein
MSVGLTGSVRENNQRDPTNRWTGARGACFATQLIESKVGCNRRARSTRSFGGSWPNNIDGLVAAEIDVKSLEGKRLRVAQVAGFSSRRLMNRSCLVSAIAPRFFESGLT